MRQQRTPCGLHRQRGRWVPVLDGRARLPAAGAEVFGIAALGVTSWPNAAAWPWSCVLRIRPAASRPKAPRLAPLAVVDVLAAGVALRQNPERLARLPRNSEGARGKRGRH
jgi:hypothetical protein